MNGCGIEDFSFLFGDINNAVQVILSLPVYVQAILIVISFFVIYGVASAVYSIIKLSLWLIYKTVIYSFILVAFLLVLVFKVIYYNLEPGKQSNNAVSETLGLFKYIIEKEQEVWPFSELFKVEKKSETEFKKAQEIQKKKAEEITKKEKTYLQSYNQKLEEQKQKFASEQFFCSKCGAKFTPNMISLLKTNNKCFCEVCGQGFEVYQWL